MPRTAQWVITDSNFIKQLRNMGYCGPQTRLCRLEVRPALPVAVYCDAGGSQAPGNIVTTDQIMAWIQANNIPGIDSLVLGCYIDTPRDLTPEALAGSLTFSGFITDTFMTTQVATFLQTNLPVA